VASIAEQGQHADRVILINKRRRRGGTREFLDVLANRAGLLTNERPGRRWCGKPGLITNPLYESEQ
jgi:hypothetical protein